MVSIYVVSHKMVDLSKLQLPSCYKRIRVGNYDNMLPLEYRDDIGEDNISSKNCNYCELTALYWIWKNDTSSDYIGLCHYRRFFTTNRIVSKSYHFIDDQYIERVLKRRRVILPKKSFFWNGTVNAYLKSGVLKDIELTEEAIKSLTPEFVPFWNSEVVNSTSNYLYNMFVMSRRDFNEYCEWLFSILSYVEKKIDMTNYTASQKRVFGYLSERLLGVWIAKKRFSVKQLNVINTEKPYSSVEKFKSFLKLFHISDVIKTVYYILKY